MFFSTFLIYKSCILYLSIPILFFYFGWLKLGIGLLLSLLLLLASYVFLKLIRKQITVDTSIFLSKEHLTAFLIMFLFLLSTGNTGFMGSWGVDIPWRNAIYQDLIHQPWPVIYDYSHSMMCYYMVFWLVPAEISSLLHLNEFGSNLVLFFWLYIGLVLIFLLLCDILKPKTEYVILTIILFLFFSGINTFGMILKSIFIEPAPLISDLPGRTSWSFSDFCINGVETVLIIRSVYLCIADVYNQFFAIAISTLLFLKFRKNIEFYALIGLLILPYSPLGFVGMFVIEVWEFVIYSIKQKNTQSVISQCKKIFSCTNILAIISLVPVFYFYFFMNTNAAALVTAPSSGNYGFFSIPINKFNSAHLILLFFYYCFYFMIYARLIYSSYKNESLYYGVLFCLIIFPFFKIGKTADFNFNATICPFIILFVLIANHLLKSFEANRFRMKEILLVFFLSVAMLTPVIQISTSIRAAYVNESFTYRWTPWDPKLSWNSFKDKEIGGFRNFLTPDYEKKIFYKYFAKK